jgi:hypothetical protein
VPVALRRLSTGANAVFRAAGSRRWHRVRAEARSLAAAWRAQRRDGVPPRLAGPTGRAVGSLVRAVAARERQRARHAALDAVQATLDLELQYRPVAEIDRRRFGLWLRQVLVDAAGRDLRLVRGDVAVLEWIRDRIAHTLSAVQLTRLDTRLEELRSNVADRQPAAAARTAAALRRVLR